MTATPEGLKKSRREFFIDQMGVEPDLPPIDGAEHLISYLHRMGTCKSNGMGLVGLDWVDIDAWCHRIKVDLSGWEGETLYLMSGAYAAQLAASRDRTAEAPYRPKGGVTQKPAENLNRGILKAFESLAKGSKRRKKPTA